MKEEWERFANQGVFAMPNSSRRPGLVSRRIGVVRFNGEQEGTESIAAANDHRRQEHQDAGDRYRHQVGDGNTCNQ